MPDERITFPSGDLTLVGVLRLPEGPPPFPGVVLCHPHPLYGGDMHNNVVLAMADGLVERGIAALRFNFRGGGDAEQSDAAAALEALRDRDEIDAGRVGLAGYSFGASVALATAPHDAGLRALAVVAPPASSLGALDALAYAKPKLVLAGDIDTFIPIGDVREAGRRLAQPLQIEILHGGDHFLVGHEAEIARHVGRFFAQTLAT